MPTRQLGGPWAGSAWLAAASAGNDCHRSAQSVVTAMIEPVNEVRPGGVAAMLDRTVALKAAYDLGTSPRHYGRGVIPLLALHVMFPRPWFAWYRRPRIRLRVGRASSPAAALLRNAISRLMLDRLTDACQADTWLVPVPGGRGVSAGPLSRPGTGSTFAPCGRPDPITRRPPSWPFRGFGWAPGDPVVRGSPPVSSPDGAQSWLRAAFWSGRESTRSGHRGPPLGNQTRWRRSMTRRGWPKS